MRVGRAGFFRRPRLPSRARAIIVQALFRRLALGGDVGSLGVGDELAGEIDAATYGEHVVPVLADVLQRFRKLDPDTPVTYYSRGTGPEYWDQLEGLPFQCLGIDWRHDIAERTAGRSSAAPRRVRLRCA